MVLCHAISPERVANELASTRIPAKDRRVVAEAVPVRAQSPDSTDQRCTQTSGPKMKDRTLQASLMLILGGAMWGVLWSPLR